MTTASESARPRVITDPPGAVIGQHDFDMAALCHAQARAARIARGERRALPATIPLEEAADRLA